MVQMNRFNWLAVITYISSRVETVRDVEDGGLSYWLCSGLFDARVRVNGFLRWGVELRVDAYDCGKQSYTRRV